MKAIVFIFLFMLSMNTFCQITVTPETLERTIDNNIPEYIFDVYVTNSSSTEQSFWWKIFREDGTPKEWDLFVCDFQLCYSPSVIACPPNKPNKMPADTTMKITFHLKSYEVNGAAKLWLEFYSDKTYQNLYDRTDSLGVVTVASPNFVNDDELNFSVYPNPVKERVFISAENLESKKIKITTIDGAEKMKLDFISSSGINVSSLSDGIYILYLTDKITGKSMSYKIFKSN